MPPDSLIPVGDSLAGFCPRRVPAASDRRTRLLSLFLVLALYACLLALLLWTWHGATPPLPMEAAIEIDLHPRQPPRTLVMNFHPLTRPRLVLPEVASPEFAIAAPEPGPVEVTPAPAAPPSSPSLGSGNAQTGADDYLMRLHDHLDKFVKCPVLFARPGRQGTTVIHFMMDSGNHVTKVEMIKSSGIAALDQEALAVIRRAEPLPPAPPPLGPGLNALIPIHCEAPPGAR